MARPKDPKWIAIQKAYEGGKDVNEIVREFKVTKKTLQNRISQGNWEIRETARKAIKGAVEVSGNFRELYRECPETAEHTAEKVRDAVGIMAKVFNGSDLIAQAVIDTVEANTKKDKIGIGGGAQMHVDVPLELKDLKDGAGALKEVAATVMPRETKKEEDAIDVPYEIEGYHLTEHRE